MENVKSQQLLQLLTVAVILHFDENKGLKCRFNQQNVFFKLGTGMLMVIRC